MHGEGDSDVPWYDPWRVGGANATTWRKATEARKVSSVKSFELISLLSILVIFAHIIRNCSVQKKITNVGPYYSGGKTCQRTFDVSDCAGRLMIWQLSGRERENRSVDGDGGGWLLERRRRLHWKGRYEEG